ncbi:MAG: hypothetical protein J6P07_02825 [Spirochaetaceae bacterium]|nr:hypothetical protein [Spirochaetaceae bacterium]
MKKTKKINLPKNKILILLAIILVVFIGLLSTCILIQSRYSEPTIADIEPAFKTEQAAKKAQEDAAQISDYLQLFDKIRNITVFYNSKL